MEPASTLRRARFFLWVDGVGGYLVCEGNEVTLGRAVGGQQVDIPLLGDVSTHHATILRRGEGYLLESRRPTRFRGREVTGAVPLTDGGMIELGSSVRLRFRQPHPLSFSALLEVQSPHRTQPPTEGVLLFAGSCVLGPSISSHVVCRDASEELILYRCGGELYGRTQPLPAQAIPASRSAGSGPFPCRDRWQGSGISLTIEPFPC